MEVILIKLSFPDLGLRELVALKRVFASGWIAGQGPETERFEKELSEKIGVRYVVAVSNATAGLFVALKALGVQDGDEVIVADYTYPATGHAVLFAGAKPIFADVDLATGNLKPESIEGLITERTKGIIAVDVAGQLADYIAINEIARRRKLFVLQDAACSIGAKQNGDYAGSQGDMAVFSFHGRKGISCGEGGAIATNDLHLYQAASKLVSFGITPAFKREKSNSLQIPVFTEFGFNFKLSDISCAIMNQQLKKLDRFILQKQRIADTYARFLESNVQIILPITEKSNLHSWQSYLIRVKDQVTRDALINHLKSNSIQSNIGTFASHVQPLYGATNECPNSKTLFTTQIALPMHTKIKRREIAKVTNSINEFFAKGDYS
jgi:perosamine synthetase